MLSIIKKSKFIIQVVILIGLISLFEAFQQYFYINRFDLADTETYNPLKLLRDHVIRWVLWGITAIYFYKKISKKTDGAFSSFDLAKSFSLIIVLVIIDILAIAIIENNVGIFGLGLEGIKQNFVFYIYQKGPIFTIAYLCLGIYTYFHHKTNVLMLKLQSLMETREEDETLYNELREKQWPNETQVLSVKIGKKLNLIPIEEIEWIQSDNYCVKIHTMDLKSYTLRSTMNKMEELLPKEIFIRIHRSAIINTSCMSSLTLGIRPTVELKSGGCIEVASSRLAEVKQVIKQTDIREHSLHSL